LGNWSDYEIDYKEHYGKSAEVPDVETINADKKGQIYASALFIYTALCYR